ncbi:MAG: spore protease YyaC [Peptococcaceae bacterium]|jgi:putative sporulation protein YyaC|nr:spore protease YyaC [Peptococcaceae bacterium]MDH7523806.1 spore protease YyaC [Peptococcaceae bacterium]
MFPSLLDYFTKAAKTEDNKIRVHMDDVFAVTKLSEHLAALLNNLGKNRRPLVICIGTDRSTGDSLGPLTGWRLSSLLHGKNIEILGTIDNPVHAQNLESYLLRIRDKENGLTVIAVDACLGQLANVGTILLEGKPLKPGAGVSKLLPEVGDISIYGIVNVGGFMEIQVLQNTRLSIVMKMSCLIANSIFLALRQTGHLN